MTFGIGSALLAIPAFGALLISLLPGRATRLIEGVAVLASAAALVLSWSLIADFDPVAAAPQFEERLPWVPEIGVTYHIGLDGLSFPMVLLTTLLSALSVLASIGSINSGAKAYFAWFLTMEAAILGVFLAQDWFLFYVFWEVALIPMLFLIGVWGGERRAEAGFSFFIYTLAGSVLMLVGMLAAYLATPDHSFEMAAMAAAQASWAREFQIFVFCTMFLGMAVKLPSVPLHGWLPLAHVQAPIPVSMMLSGVLLKMGAYGLFRLLDVAPQGAAWSMPWLFVLGVAGIVYGALIAWRQDDLKAMVAFSSISHMGFVLVGVAAFNPTGFSGAMTQMFAHGIATAALFMLVGVLYENAHTRHLSELTGIGRQSPRFAVVMTVTLLATMGVPGLSGFVAEFNVLVGAYDRWGLWVLLAGIGVLVTSGYCLRVFARVFDGAESARAARMPDLTARQVLVLAPLVALMLLIGLFPGPLLQLSDPALGRLAATSGLTVSANP